MIFTNLAFVLDELIDAIHCNAIFCHLGFHDVRRLQAIILPIETTLNCPIQNTWKFLQQFITKIFILLFSRKCSVEWDRFDPPPNTMICIVDLWQTVRR